MTDPDPRVAQDLTSAEGVEIVKLVSGLEAAAAKSDGFGAIGPPLVARIAGDETFEPPPHRKTRRDIVSRAVNRAIPAGVRIVGSTSELKNATGDRDSEMDGRAIEPTGGKRHWYKRAQR